MKRILSQENGVTEIFHHDSETDVSMIETRQDVSPDLEYTQALAKDKNYTRAGMKEGWLHYGHIPASIVLELQVKHGLNVMDPDHIKAVFRIINEKYPKFKTTEMMHNPKG